MDRTTKVVISILLINLILIGIIFYQLKGKKDECINNPLIYGAKLLSKANDGEFSCNCYIIKGGGYSSPKIYFDSQGMNVDYEKIEVNINRQDINFSLFNELIIIE